MYGTANDNESELVIIIMMHDAQLDNVHVTRIL